MRAFSKVFFCALVAVLVCAWTPAALAKKTPMVGGAAMYPSKTFTENLANSTDHTEFLTALKSAGLFDTLGNPGPYTMFAPVNAAFDKLPAGSMEKMLRPENKEMLANILKFHVVPGMLTMKQMNKLIKKGKGKATLKTLQGGNLTISIQDGALVLADENNNLSTVTIGDIPEHNGVLYIVSAVLAPHQ